MSQTEYVRRTDPKKLIVAITIVAIIAVAALTIVMWPRPRIFVYTYDSFMLWGDSPDTIDEIVFGPFERQYGVDIEIVRLPTDASGIVTRLLAENTSPIADVVIGIDNILVLQEQVRSVLEPYNTTNIDLLSPGLADALSPERYLIPFDYGLVTQIYSLHDMNTTTHPALANLTLDALASMASLLVTEDPRFSSPGLSFLLSEIAISEKILKSDWKSWWTSVKGQINIQEGWSEAWSVWDSDPNIHMMVSYGTDPAYSAYYSGTEPDIATAPFRYNNTDYAWIQIEGIGLVRGGPNPQIGRLFIDYCLTAAVQSYIALNQWMFPANPNVDLHDAFDYALSIEDVTPLNMLLAPTEIAANLTRWLDEWESLMA